MLIVQAFDIWDQTRMAAINKSEATNRILAELTQMELLDLVEVHNELYPSDPMSSIKTSGNQAGLSRMLTTRIQSGLESEELVDVWNVIFPHDRNVWYDEDAHALHLNEEPENVGYSE